MSEICGGYRVSGRVQGVGYRWWTCKVADRLGVRGTVANRVDGSVEVQVCGPPDAIAMMVEELRKGPWAARVDGVERFDSAEAGSARDFTVIG